MFQPLVSRPPDTRGRNVAQLAPRGRAIHAAWTFAIITTCFVTVVARSGAQTNYEPYYFGTLAGNAGYGAVDGTGSAARFNHPQKVALDSAGTLYVADTSNNTIRKVTPAGVVTTFVGSPGVTGSANGTGSAALFSRPTGLTLDSAGNLFVADTGNNAIRKVTPGGVVTSVAVGVYLNQPQGIAIDAAGNLYVADTGNYKILKITPAAVVTTYAGTGVQGACNCTGKATSVQLYNPTGIALDSTGTLYIADYLLRKVTPDGQLTTLQGIGGSDVAIDSSGSLYVSNSHKIQKMTPDGVVTTLAGSAAYGSSDGTGSAAQFYFPDGIAIDSVGTIYVADSYNNEVRKVTSAGVVSTLAGLAGGSGSADGTGSAARFSEPWSVTVDAAGNVYVADVYTNNTIRKVTPSGVVTTLAGLAGVTGSSDGTGSVARFNRPFGVALDSAGNVLWRTPTIRLFGK